jgi:cytochrome c oxidase cbb3-type subunit III
MKLLQTLAVCAGAALIFASGEMVVKAQHENQHDKADTELRLGEIMAGSKHEHKLSEAGQKYQDKDKHIRAGMKLYHKLNCVGCHFDGGGGMGPALIDDDWVYGTSIDHIAASIRDGRPNGMPSFHAIASDEEIWQLAAYVHSGMKEHEHGAETKDAKDEGKKEHPDKGDAKEKPGEGHQH